MKNMHLSRWTRARSVLLAIAPGIILLPACATIPQGQATGDFDARFAQVVVDASELAKEARIQDSIVLMEKMAKSYPDRSEPLVQIAKWRFEAGQYGLAIVAADDALAKAPLDPVAMSVRAVSGLRVATESLDGLRGNESVFGAARPDATKLASTLRDVLGEDLLVPPSQEPAVQTRRRTARNNTRANAPALLPPGDTSRTQTGRRVPSSMAVDGDPFSVLRR